LGYAAFYQDYTEYNVVDQTGTIEPQYKLGNTIFSLPIGYNYVFEDGDPDYYRYNLSPTATYQIPNTNQAIAINSLVSRNVDVDDIHALDEDGNIIGAGCGYLILFEKLGRIRLSIDYQHVQYDATVREYGAFAGDNGWPSFSNNQRSDDLLSSNINLQYDFTPSVGLFTDYTFIHAHSNVKVYNYDRNLIEGGISIKY
jgi:hypothetical protein